MSMLTTHILDTVVGKPAGGVQIELYKISGDDVVLITATISNADGRTDEPILAKNDFDVGTYELRFFIGSYFSNAGYQLDDPLFLDVIPIRFSIASTETHYHVPLLASPCAYSTYRGS